MVTVHCIYNLQETLVNGHCTLHLQLTGDSSAWSLYIASTTYRRL